MKLQTIIGFLQPVCTVYVLRKDAKSPIKSHFTKTLEIKNLKLAAQLKKFLALGPICHDKILAVGRFSCGEIHSRIEKRKISNLWKR